MKKADAPNRASRYPKVKVRGETGLTTILEKTEVLILRVVRSLTFTKVSVGTVHSASDVKVTEACTERGVVSSDPQLPKGKSNGGDLDDTAANSRASPILRPRATLSSPDNDGMIGSMNRRYSEMPHSKLQGPQETKQSILTHRNSMEENPRVKAGIASTQVVVNPSTNIRKQQAHEPVTRRSSTSIQRSLDTEETQRVHVMSPVTSTPRSPLARPVTPTHILSSEMGEAAPTPRVHVTRPVTPPTPRSPVARPVTPPPPRSPIARPVTPPPPRSPITRPVTPTPKSAMRRPATPPLKSPISRPATPTPKSPTRRPATPTPKLPATQSAISAPRSPLTRSFMPTPKSPLTRPVTATQKLPAWR